jgi:hypothetical protein
MSPYMMAQSAIAQLKAAMHQLLASAPSDGLTNADIGRALGIYSGHVGHEGHIPRTLLALMEAEGVVQQDAHSKKWCLRQFPADEQN